MKAAIYLAVGVIALSTLCLMHRKDFSRGKSGCVCDCERHRKCPCELSKEKVGMP